MFIGKKRRNLVASFWINQFGIYKVSMSVNLSLLWVFFSMSAGGDFGVWS